MIAPSQEERLKKLLHVLPLSAEELLVRFPWYTSSGRMLNRDLKALGAVRDANRVYQKPKVAP